MNQSFDDGSLQLKRRLAPTTSINNPISINAQVALLGTAFGAATTKAKAMDVAGLKLASPEYVAVKVRLPGLLKVN